MFKRLALAAFLAPLISGPVGAQTLPSIPPVPDADRSVTYNPTSPTQVFPVPFPIYGDCSDVSVAVAGTPQAPSAFTCSSVSGRALPVIPRPITDMQVTLASPVKTGSVVIAGAYHPRNLNIPTAPGITRREFNETVNTIVSSLREVRSGVLALSPPALYGSWSSTVFYPINAVVVYGGATFQASQPSVNQTPSSTSAYWQAVVTGGQVTANLPFVATGAQTTRAAADRAAERYSVRDFGVTCNGTTDDSAALAGATNALANTGAELVVPGNCRIRLAGAAQVWLRGVHLSGPGVKEIGTQLYAYGSQGGTILIDTPTLANGGVSPFIVSSDWSMTGLNFYWPGQTEYTAAAASGTTAAYGGTIPFAPLFAVHGSDYAYFWSFSDNQVENAYDIGDLSGATDAGHFHWERNSEFATHYHVTLRSMGGESWVTNNQFSIVASLYLNSGTNTAGPGATQSPFYLRTFAAYNAEALHVVGNGTPSAASASAVAGLRFDNNYNYVLRYGVHVAGGSIGISTFTDNGYDEVSTPFQADSGGTFSSVTITGGSWICQNLSSPGGFYPASIAPCFSVSGGAPGSRVSLSNVQIGAAVGAGIVFSDTGTDGPGGNLSPNLSITGGSILNVGNVSAGNPYNGITFNAPGGDLSISALPLSTTAASQAGAQGVVVNAARSSSLAGVIFGGWNIPEVVNAAAGRHSLVGSSSHDTTAVAGTAAVLGPGAWRVTQAGNVWDKAPQVTATYDASGAFQYVQCNGGAVSTAPVDCSFQTQGYGNIRFGNLGGQTGFIGTAGLTLPPTTVAALQPCTAVLAGTRSGVTDATAVTYGSTPVGGGTNKVGVYCTGSGWTEQ